MKKILKIVGVILGALIIIFLLAGLVVPKVEYSTKVTVNKSLSEVWTKYNDMNTINIWIPEIKSIETIKETPDIVGSEYKMVVESEGKTISMTETVTEFKYLDRIGLFFDAGDMIKEDMVTFKPEGSSTTIYGQHSCKGKNYLHKCMFAFFKSMFKDIDQGYLDQFKKWVEGE